MAEQLPLLILPEPVGVERRRPPGGPPRIHFPSHRRQARRLTPKFQRLRRSLVSAATRLQTTPDGTQPEQVIVLETIGAVEELRRAIERVQGLDWLWEWAEEELAPDEDFYEEADTEKLLSGRLYLIMSNQRGMDELIRLWRLYCRDPDVRFAYGLGRLKTVFKQLRDVRRWSVRDRLEETGVLDYWREMVQHEERVLCEAELWFHGTDEARARAQANVEGVVAAAGGQCIAHTIIEEIAYHGALLDVPSDQIRRVLDHQDIDLVTLEDVIFFLPSGQMAAPTPPADAPTPAIDRPAPALPSGDPIVALLDGLPMENHPLLQNRLVVDDPDGWASTYPVSQRWHGTGMASLVVHGELDGNEAPQQRPIYVRPILRPNPYDWRQPPEECIPHGVLQVDLVHTAIRRIIEGHGQDRPVAPSVRIVNLSVCDPTKLFLASVSPMARLLDWLSWRYSILFTVSAGNHPEDIVLDVPTSNFGSLSDADRQRETVRALSADNRNRRLLAPAEAINVLTVASTHEDLSTVDPRDTRHNPFVSGLPAPFNAQGHGFRRSVKPDVLLPGGRQFMTEKLGTTHAKATLEFSSSRRPPGHSVACPGTGASTAYARGTSNSTALASRHAGLLYDSLMALRSEPNGQLLDEGHLPVLVKALLVHGASWAEAYEPIREALMNDNNRGGFNKLAARFLGYGRLDSTRTSACEAYRATVLGVGSLMADDAHLFRLPLPDGLAGVQAWKRLVVTLAWFTPVNPRHRAYRCAHLWFNKPQHALGVDRQECHWQATQRGTVQHEIFEGDSADAFTTGDSIDLQVNCREDAGGLNESVPYAVVLTLETAPELRVPIYEQIRDMIQIPVPIAPE